MLRLIARVKKKIEGWLSVLREVLAFHVKHSQRNMCVSTNICREHLRSAMLCFT